LERKILLHASQGRLLGVEYYRGVKMMRYFGPVLIILAYIVVENMEVLL